MKKCNVLMVVDKSGSMAGTANQTIQGYNEYIQQFKEDAKDMDIRVSMISFNGEVFEHFWDTPANELNELTNKDYKPSGSTAMWDGIGYGLRKIQNTTDVNDENNTYLVIIISDGEENSSTHIRQEEVKELISSYEKNTKWTFTFMGCDKKYLMQLAKKIAIPASNMAVWENTTSKGTVRGMGLARSALRSKLADYKADNFNSVNYYSADNSIADFTIDESVNVDVDGKNPVDPNVIQNPSVLTPPFIVGRARDFMHSTSCKANTNSADWSSYEKSWKQD